MTESVENWPYAGAKAKPVLGAPLQVVEGRDTFPLAATNSLDPRNAAARTLEAFLLSQVFVIAAEGAPDEPFSLKNVQFVWPRPNVEVDYPTASIIEPDTSYSAHSLAPTPLENTLDVFCKDSVLWKTDELAVTFQVDWWLNEDPQLEAVAARIPDMFSPDEGRSGIMLAGHKEYFDAPVRATLLGHHRINNSETAFERERRLMTRVLCDIDVLHLRKVSVPLKPVVLFKEPDIA